MRCGDLELQSDGRVLRRGTVVARVELDGDRFVLTDPAGMPRRSSGWTNSFDSPEEALRTLSVWRSSVAWRRWRSSRGVR